MSGQRQDERDKRALRFCVCIYVFMSCTCIWILVVGDVVNLPLVDKRLVDDPGGLGDNFVDPSAVANRLAAFDNVSDNAWYREDTHRSACVMAVRALWEWTSSSEHTPTMRYTDGKECLAWRSCKAWLEQVDEKGHATNERRKITQNGRDHRHL